ncbi:hypothetical protein, partial [Flavobacterium zhairuonense]|uniref:hypothetical protein n=1 Tax=Flavobacterium zhairuonense TaxID=2493631 RepID=UPI001ABFECBA
MKRLLSGWQDSNLRPSRSQSGRDNRSLYFFLKDFQFIAKKKSFQKMKRLLSGWQDSNLRP